MVREDSKKAQKAQEEEMPKFGAGSEFGRDQREEARRKRFGGRTKKFKPEDQPWLMRVGSKKDSKQYRGLREGSVSDNSAYYVFTHAPDGSFEAHPIANWYSFAPRVTYQTLDADEAEEKFASRNKIMNHFAVMVSKKLKPDQDGGDGDDDEDGVSAGGKKGAKKKENDFKVTDMEDWEGDGDEFGSESDDDEDGGGKKKKKGKGDDDDEDGNKKKKKKNKKDKDEEDAPDEAFEDSDDGDGECKEQDYISDESSDAESDLEEMADIKGVDQDEGLAKMLDSDSDEEDEDNKDGKKKDSDDDDPETPAKKGKAGGKNSAKNSKNNSRAGSPSPNDGEEDGGGDAKNKAEKRKALVESVLDGTASDTPAKKMRLDGNGSGAASGFAVDSAIEQDARKWLARKQMTMADLFKKFFKKYSLPKEKLAEQLVSALKKINPQKKKAKGVTYFHLKSV